MTGLEMTVGGGEADGEVMRMEGADTYGVSRTPLTRSSSPSAAALALPLSLPPAVTIDVSSLLPFESVGLSAAAICC